MAQTALRWQVYAGSTPSWTDIAGRLCFSGSPRSIYANLAPGEWNRGTHLVSASPGIDLCGKYHVPNVRYADSTHFVNAAGETKALNDSNLSPTECTLRVRLETDDPVETYNTRLFAYDRLSTTLPIPGVEIQVFHRGVGATSWTQLNNGDKGEGGDRPGMRLDLPNEASATPHTWYFALSARPQPSGPQTWFNLGFYVEFY